MHKIDLPGYTIWSADSEGFWNWMINGVAVVSAAAEIDIVNESGLEHALQIAATYATTVVVDMSVTTHCGAPGLRILAEAGRKLKDDGGELRVVTRNELTRRCMNITGDDRVFRLFTSLPEALTGIQRRGDLRLLAA